MLKQKKPAVHVVAIEPENAAVLSGRAPKNHIIQGIGAGFVPKILNRAVIDEIATVTDDAAIENSRRLARAIVAARRRAPLTRGLNRNHNRVLKDVFKGAATAAKARPGPLQDGYQARVAGGMAEALASVTLARKLAAIVLRLWKKGERFDPTKLMQPAR